MANIPPPLALPGSTSNNGRRGGRDETSTSTARAQSTLEPRLNPSEEVTS